MPWLISSSGCFTLTNLKKIGFNIISILEMRSLRQQKLSKRVKFALLVRGAQTLNWKFGDHALPTASAVNQLCNLNKPRKLSGSEGHEVGLALDYLVKPVQQYNSVHGVHPKGGASNEDVPSFQWGAFAVLFLLKFQVNEMHPSNICCFFHSFFFLSFFYSPMVPQGMTDNWVAVPVCSHAMTSSSRISGA